MGESFFIYTFFIYTHFFRNTTRAQNKTYLYEGWNFNSGNYLFTTDTKYIHVSKFYCPSV